jgi:uncharacterized protein (TIGR03067 family)
MTRRPTVIVALGMLVLAVNSARADDQEKIQGIRTYSKMLEDGEDVPAAELAMQTIEFKGNKMIIRHGSTIDKEYEFTLNASKKPSAIDFKGPSGKTEPGIYDLDGDTLRICMAEAGRERPAKFESPVGSKVTYIVLKKQAK